MSTIATAIFAIGICGLFFLTRDKRERTSPAIVLPVLWILIAGSRMVSAWFQTAQENTSAAYLEGSPLDRNILTALLALGVIVVITRWRRASNFLISSWPVLLFFSYCALSLTWSDFPDVALKRLIKALGDVVMVLVVLTDPLPLTAVRRFYERAAFVLLPASILLINYYPELGRSYNMWTWKPSWTGVTTDKNMLGMISLIMGLTSLWRCLNLIRGREGKHKSRQLITQVVVLSCAIWLLLKANSATSLACFLLAGSIIVATNLISFTRKPAIIHAIVGSELFLALYALFLHPGAGLVEQLGRNSTLSGRTELWDLILGMAKNRLFGVGYESFWLGPRLDKIWAIYWFKPTEAHNAYIEIYLDLGWIGLCLIALIAVWGYMRIMKAFRQDAAINSIRLAFFVVAMIYSMTEHAFREMNPVWMSFLLATIGFPKLRAAFPNKSAKKLEEQQPVFALPEPEPEPAPEPTHVRQRLRPFDSEALWKAAGSSEK
jgi:exopolysaccharide production protein ExoQ